MIVASLASFYITQYLFSNPVRRTLVRGARYHPAKFVFLIKPVAMNSDNQKKMVFISIISTNGRGCSMNKYVKIQIIEDNNVIFKIKGKSIKKILKMIAYKFGLEIEFK